MNKIQAIESLKSKFRIVGILDSLPTEFYLQTWSELESMLKKVYRESYQNDERIVIVLDRNNFNNSLTFQNYLQKLQSIINAVDISNFFIIILHNDVDNQSHIMQNCANISTDPIPLNYEIYNDDVEKPSSIDDTFCILPWIHTMVTSFNKIQPCCMASEDIGDLSKTTLKDAWNSTKMRHIRHTMMNGAYHPICSKCYELESLSEQSLRISSNKKFQHHLIKASDTQEDGTFEKFELNYLDIRYSNLCNLRCRTCNHHSSSKWYGDEKRLDPSYNKPLILRAGRYETDVQEQILPHLDTVESIYFAGGEPLIMEEHYWMLDELESRQKFDVRIFYNTNFTAVDIKSRHLFDYWKKFNNITVGASLDAMGPRAEYLRKDTCWSKIVENRKLMREKAPHVEFRIAATVSIINVLHIPDFHQSWVDQGLIDVNQIDINLLMAPDYYRADIGTENFKQLIQERYHRHYQWLSKMGATPVTIQNFEKIVNHILSNDNTKLLDQFKKITHQIDSLRSENILEVFPELHELF